MSFLFLFRALLDDVALLLVLLVLLLGAVAVVEHRPPSQKEVFKEQLQIAQKKGVHDREHDQSMMSVSRDCKRGYHQYSWPLLIALKF